MDQGCATSGCHSAASAAANLVLTTGSSYENTVGVPSTQVPGRPRIAPGRANSSYIMQKLEGTQAKVGGSGVRMPPDGPANDTLLHELGQWIEEGAEDN